MGEGEAIHEVAGDIGQALADISRQVLELSEQVRALSDQAAYLAEQARAGARRRQEWDELKADATPVLNDLYRTTVEELAEIEPHVQLEDILRLVKRLARNTRNFEQMLDQLESLQDFLADASPLTFDVFNQIVYALDEAERKGYFGFALEGQQLVDNVVASFSQDDVRQLGDNIVLILNTVKAMTQPEFMNLVNNITVMYRDVEHGPALDTSLIGLLRQMRDPTTRRGLALTMRMLHAVAAQSTDRVQRQNK